MDIKSKENAKRIQRESQRGVNMNNKTITTSVKNFENRMKSLETKNIKKYGESLTWVSLYNKFNKCIVEIDKNTITFDGEKYKEILKEMEAQYEQ